METFEEHLVLAPNHVVVIVLGEAHAEAVRGPGALAVADVIGEDQEVARDVERLAGAEEHVGEDAVEERMRVAAGAVQEEHGVVDLACAVVVRRAEGQIVQLQLGQGFTGAEAEVLRGVVAGRAMVQLGFAAGRGSGVREGCASLCLGYDLD